MRISLLVPLPLALVIFATAAFAGAFEGPLIVKNGFPLYAAIGNPSLTSAEPENTLDVNFSYANTYLVGASKNWYFGIDLETAITDIQFKHVVGKETEIGIEVPVIRYGPGFFDGAISSYHDLVGIHNAYGRNSRPKNRFLLTVAHDGDIVIRGDPGKTALGDMMFEVKQALYHDRASTCLSMQAFVNVPTGDADSAFGSGQANGGIAVLMNEQLRSDIMLYMNAGIGLSDTLKAMKKVKLRNYYYGGVGLEWVYSKSIALNAQIVIQSSPFPQSGVHFIDDPSLLGSFGGRYKVDARSSLGIAVTEDLDAAGAPDVMIGADYRYTF